MTKMNNEVMEQLLKDLAANVGYDLIPKPFDTPFTEDSIEGLPDFQKFFWTVPASVLSSKKYEEFRKTCIKADIIDTVCTTSLPWPTNENDHVAIILIDVTRRRRGSVKFVDASEYENLQEDWQMYVVNNMLIHDIFPGEEFLAFQVVDDAVDYCLDYPWNEQVGIYATRDINSLLPSNYIYKSGLSVDDIVGSYFDILNPSEVDYLSNLRYPAILISSLGKLCPEKIESAEELLSKPFEDKWLLVPNEGTNVDAAILQFSKEEVLRQLPLNRRITEDDLWRVKIENDGIYHHQTEEESFIELTESFLKSLREIELTADELNEIQSIEKLLGQLGLRELPSNESKRIQSAVNGRLEPLIEHHYPQLME